MLDSLKCRAFDYRRHNVPKSRRLNDIPGRRKQILPRRLPSIAHHRTNVRPDGRRATANKRGCACPGAQRLPVLCYSAHDRGLPNTMLYGWGALQWSRGVWLQRRCNAFAVLLLFWLRRRQMRYLCVSVLLMHVNVVGVGVECRAREFARQCL